MVPSKGTRTRRSPAAPRTRGDGPSSSSPSRRGQSCSPHTRGWSQAGSSSGHRRTLLPAHAGMVPPLRACWTSSRTAPRTRGDGPQASGQFSATLLLLPAHAGMVPWAHASGEPVMPAPRTRGDGPKFSIKGLSWANCSPHTRGWSRSFAIARWGSGPAPRTRGDGPIGLATTTEGALCSPHTRGWSLHLAPRSGPLDLLLAHAGLAPPQRSCGGAGTDCGFGCLCGKSDTPTSHTGRRGEGLAFPWVGFRDLVRVARRRRRAGTNRPLWTWTGAAIEALDNFQVGCGADGIRTRGQIGTGPSVSVSRRERDLAHVDRNGPLCHGTAACGNARFPVPGHGSGTALA